MRPLPLLITSLFAAATLSGCVSTTDDATIGDDQLDFIPLPVETGFCLETDQGPAPPPGEEVIGIQPIQLIFGGSLKHADTSVLLIPPTHGDLAQPTNSEVDGMAYLEATLEGIYAWEPAIDLFIEKYPEYSYLDNITVEVEIFDGGVPDRAGYDIVMGYIETSGPVFRGVAVDPGVDTQAALNDAGLGGFAKYGNRYILLSMFAYSERAGQTEPDFPEAHEMRGVTMHEFAHTWGLGHSTTWTPGCGGDFMNSPYPYVYGDGDPLGDGGERTKPLCISSLGLHGLGELYRWYPNGAWEGSSGETTMPEHMVYKEYCEIFDDAQTMAQATMRDAGFVR